MIKEVKLLLSAIKNDKEIGYHILVDSVTGILSTKAIRKLEYGIISKIFINWHLLI